MIPLFRPKSKVILDTNMLLMPGKGIDVISIIEEKVNFPFTFCVMARTYEELENLMQKAKKGSDKLNAKLGYLLAKQKSLKTLYSSLHHVDDAIIDTITKNDYVATLDKALQKRVIEKGAKVIAVRNRSQVIIHE